MIVYAPSYPSFVESLRNYSWDEIEVITNNDKIEDFCSKTAIKCTNLRLSKVTNKALLKKQIMFIKEFASNFSRKQFMFCFYGFDLLGLFFMYELRKRNEVYFKNKDHFFDEKGTLFLIRKKQLFKDFLLYLLLFKIKFSYFIVAKERGFFGLPIKRLVRDYKQLPPIKENVFEQNIAYFSGIYNIPKDAVIFIDQGNVAFEIEDETINKIISSYHEKAFFVKAHPNFELSNKLLIKFNQISKEIPLELIINKKMTLIGICSSSLIYSQTNKKISIIDKVKWKSEEAFLKYRKVVQGARNIEII